MSISESDWRTFKSLRALALDRFCRGVLADAKTISEHGALSAHARYGMLCGVIHDRNKDMAHMFDYYSRSSAYSCLALMVHHDRLWNNLEHSAPSICAGITSANVQLLASRVRLF